MLQYITDPDAPISIDEQVKAVLKGGCKWVQLRLRHGASHEEVLETAKRIKILTDAENAFLIIYNDVDVCRDANATGVHLDKNATLPSRARLELGPLAIIGISAYNYNDVLSVRSLDIDYICFVPFAKCSLMPGDVEPLGIEGMEEMSRRMREDGINIPHVASCGVTLESVKPLLEADMDGIAVSGAISTSQNPTESTRQFIELLPAGE